jgi:YesN/AraC family two-component response regulator
LKETGDIVLTAYSGQECLESLEKENVDVVVLDIKMPGMDGIETLKEIKKRYPIVEVILLTGHGAIETAVEGMKLGAYDYLLKPADAREISEKLQGARQRKDEQEERIRKAEQRSLLRRGGNI